MMTFKYEVRKIIGDQGGMATIIILKCSHGSLLYYYEKMLIIMEGHSIRYTLKTDKDTPKKNVAQLLSGKNKYMYFLLLQVSCLLQT